MACALIKDPKESISLFLWVLSFSNISVEVVSIEEPSSDFLRLESLADLSWSCLLVFGGILESERYGVSTMKQFYVTIL